jgi:signal transduction histidine kinase/ActR/RegA family two-component response regulator
MHKFFSSKHVITISLTIILILVFSITLISLLRLHALHTHLEIINQHSCVKKQLLQTMLHKSRERLLAVQSMQATDDIFARQEIYNHFNLLASDFIQARDNLMAMLVTENERRLARQALLLVTEASTRQYEAILILLDGGEARASLEGITIIQQALHETLQQLIDLQQQIATENFKLANNIYYANWYLIPLLAVFSGILILYLMIIVFTRLEKLENLLVKSEHEFVLAREARDNFWANLSHDLRTPLNAVTNMSQLLLDTPLNPEQRELVMTINHSGDNFLKLIDGVLDFSKLEAGRLKLLPQVFELRQLVAQLIGVADNKAKLKDLELTLLYDDKIPIYLLGDHHRLAQVMEHLLSNAIKFTERGEILLSLTARRPNEFNLNCNNCIELYVMVKDSGIGIPLEQRDNLFEPYVYSNRRHRGTGISLALCKRLCELMGGTLWIEGESGSSFHFTVLLDIPTDSQFMATTDKHFAPVSNLRILLVEDEFTSQKVAQLVLRKLGYEIDIVNDGAKGVEAVRQYLYDIVLMDVQMPELDGFAATKAIIAAWSNQRPYIIAMTAHALDEDRERCLAGGMDDYISKPITAEELQAAIARWQQWRANN